MGDSHDATPAAPTSTAPRFSYQLVIFDWDGTLVRVRPELGYEFPKRLFGDYEPIPGRQEWLSALDGYAMFDERLHLAVASNQGGIAYNYHTFDDTYDAICALAHSWFGIDHARICPHHPKGFRSRYKRECDCRKPGPGMLRDLMHTLDALPTETLMVGDRDDDRLAAAASGCAFMWADDFFAGDPTALALDLSKLILPNTPPETWAQIPIDPDQKSITIYYGNSAPASLAEPPDMWLSGPHFTSGSWKLALAIGAIDFASGKVLISVGMTGESEDTVSIGRMVRSSIKPEWWEWQPAMNEAKLLGAARLAAQHAGHGAAYYRCPPELASLATFPPEQGEQPS